LRLLRAIVEIGHRLEGVWGNLEARTPELHALRANVAACANAESPYLRRLAVHIRDLHDDMSARHLAAILVPFERLLGRALRDDEFMVSVNDVPERPRQIAPMVVIADNLRSAFNVGAIVRTSEALGLEGVWLTGYTPIPSEEKTARTSMGAQSSIHWKSLPRVNDAISRAKFEGYTVVALETAAVSEDFDNFIWPERVALVVGNERFGLESDTLTQVDRVLKIPLFGVKNSLNVGVAFGIAANHYRQTYTRLRVGTHQTPLHPIGIFHSPARFPYEARRQGSEDMSTNIGTVELYPGHQFEQALEDLHGFERIWLLYRFHHNNSWKPKTLPPRGPHIKRGVFATRSPYRPNPLGMSAVELVSVEGLRLKVRGFDLLDGTPIFDIKPYLPYSDAFPEARSGWTESLSSEAFHVALSTLAKEQLCWLEANGITQLTDFLMAQLQYDPTDAERKRVSRHAGKNLFCLSYRTWRADFQIAADSKNVMIVRLRSGYSPTDLEGNTTDFYADKSLHREFNSIHFNGRPLEFAPAQSTDLNDNATK
jgi:tRNA-Thr(GGU) m(6)t(6)A37 methyltransferase TsaA